MKFRAKPLFEEGMNSENDQLENKIFELKNYTDQKIREIE